MSCDLVRLGSFGLLACAALLGCRTGQGAPSSASPTRSSRPTPHQQTRALLCADVDDRICLSACSEDLSPRAHDECLIDLRFASDPEARRLARAIYDTTHILPGVAKGESIEGYRGESVDLFPALPLGDDRHHLAWLHASLESFDTFLSTLKTYASKEIRFEARPNAFVFFRTAKPAFPSAFVVGETIAYNLDGPLHTERREMHETFFHELFHLNDGKRGTWSETALKPIFDAILRQCGDDRACLRPFAPHGSTVVGGTFYAFDEKTGDHREYAAELALRYFLEHEAILAGSPLPQPPFKCQTEENHVAWDRLVGEFFGGVDLSPECAADAPGHMSRSRARD